MPTPRREALEVVTLRQGGKVILELAEADAETIVIVAGKQGVPHAGGGVVPHVSTHFLVAALWSFLPWATW